jgi:ubiquinone/menaquinone biosynthesis C-methylase UbiE
MEVAGIDISREMINYANARAYSQHLHNASFGVQNFLEEDSSFASATHTRPNE